MGNQCSGLSTTIQTVPSVQPPDAELSELSITDRSLSGWKSKLTTTHARSIFVKDGSIPKDCPKDLLELRVHLSEPELLKYFTKLVDSAGLLDLLSCWADIMEFKNSRASDSEKTAAATALFNKYIAVDQRIELIGHPLTDELCNDVTERYRQLLSHADDLDSHLDLFDGVLHVLIEHLHDKVFVPFRLTYEYRACVNVLKRAYNHVLTQDFIYMEEIGRGGFGAVVHCVKKSTGVHYALKIQTKSSLIASFAPDYSRVTSELDVLASLSHPFVVCLAYAFQTSTLVMLVMEMSEGEL
jgi:hypothetical protein